jgi:hypothetical protein
METRKEVSPRFEDNCHHCLVQFWAHLISEEISPLVTKVAAVIRKCSKVAAATVRERVEKEMPIILEAQQAAAQEDQKSEKIFPDDFSNLEDTIKLPDLEVVVLTSSTAFEMLKENLTLLIRLHPVARALYEMWPVPHSLSTPVKILYVVE